MVRLAPLRLVRVFGAIGFVDGFVPCFHVAIPYVLVKLKCALFRPWNGRDPERDS